MPPAFNAAVTPHQADFLKRCLQNFETGLDFMEEAVTPQIKVPLYGSAYCAASLHSLSAALEIVGIPAFRMEE